MEKDKEYNARLERFICAAVTAYGSMSDHCTMQLSWIDKMTKKALELYDELERVDDECCWTRERVDE